MTKRLALLALLLAAPAAAQTAQPAIPFQPVKGLLGWKTDLAAIELAVPCNAQRTDQTWGARDTGIAWRCNGTIYVQVFGGGGSADAFTTIDAPTGTDPVASGASTLTLACTAPLACAGNSGTDTVTWSIDLSAYLPSATAAATYSLLGHTHTLAGDVDGDVGSTDLDEAAVESELESVLDAADLQGTFPSARTSVADAGGYYTATDVEAALQEIGADARWTNARAPSGAAGGDLSGTYPNPSVADDSHSHTSSTLPATTTYLGGSIQDSEVDNDLTIAGGSIATTPITLVQSASPTPTAEGLVEWDTDDNRLAIGDGAATKLVYPGAHAGAASDGAAATSALGVSGFTASKCARFDGSGNLAAASGDCASGDTSGTPGGSSGQVQRNASSAFAGGTLWDDGTSLVEQRNGATSQTFRLFHTYTDSSNYQGLSITHGSGYSQLAGVTAGTGADDVDLKFLVAGSNTRHYFLKDSNSKGIYIRPAESDLFTRISSTGWGNSSTSDAGSMVIAGGGFYATLEMIAGNPNNGGGFKISNVSGNGFYLSPFATFPSGFSGIDIAAFLNRSDLTLPVPITHATLVIPRTADYTVEARHSATLFTNEGATAKPILTLPSAAVGYTFSAYVQDSDGVRVKANTGDTIRVGASVSGSAGYCESTTVGDSGTWVAINATEWVPTAIVGTGWSCT